METFGKVDVLQPGETPAEAELWVETVAGMPEDELPIPRIPDDVPEADLLEQTRLP